ncbi:DUF4365 domain-containing protein [Frankia tisae]|uniref:DUF4365 domain-containing protein n=1 Tax=Frankia tisae TaxID=2950104 RepID=UPI0021C1AB3D|nr:DUF4365 domain-containing protein [Frankia tisae]
MLDRWNHQGTFAENYVRALAAAAGLLIYRPEPDLDGVDLGFRYPGRSGLVSSPTVEVQVKSWSKPQVSGGEFLYDGLDGVQYNKLVDGPFVVPRFLVIVIVPPDSDSYTRIDTDGLLLRRLAYFHGFDGATPLREPARRRGPRIRVPVGNVLTVSSLRRLVHACAAPDDPRCLQAS